jgi:hypothetical protein
MKTIKKTALTLIICFISFSTFSQERSKSNSNIPKSKNGIISDNIQISNIDIETPIIMEVEDFVAYKENFELGKNLSYSNAKWLKSLLYDADQPSVYYYANEKKSFGENPTNLYTDIISLNSLIDAKIPHSIELVRINIENTNQLNSIIDLKLLDPFKKIKYIYIVSNVDINEGIIKKMMPSLGFQYEVFYSEIKRDTKTIIKK